MVCVFILNIEGKQKKSTWPVVGFDYGSYKWTVKKNHKIPSVFQGCWRIATLGSTSQMPSIKLSWRSVKYYLHHLEHVLHYTSPFFQVWVGTIDCIRMISVASRSEKQSQCRSIKRTFLHFYILWSGLRGEGCFCNERPHLSGSVSILNVFFILFFLTICLEFPDLFWKKCFCLKCYFGPFFVYHFVWY